MEKNNQEIRNRRFATKLTGVKRVLCSIAGSDLTILAQYPAEISKHARIGAIILSTAVLASISMFFAILTISKSIPMGIIAGILWGIAIFILDSFIVASYKKHDKKWREFKIALPRIILAIILGFSISIPLELQVFSNEIGDELVILQMEKDNERMAEARTTYDKSIAPYQAEKETLEKEIKDYRAILKPYEDSVISIGRELTDEVGGTGRTGKLSYGPVAKQINQRLDSAIVYRNKIADQLAPKINAGNKRIVVLDSLIATTAQPVVEKSKQDGLSAQLDALHRLTDKNSYVMIAYVVFFFLILGLETAPIFVKMFTPKSSYDIVLAMNEYVAEMEQEKRKSDLHERLNTEIEMVHAANTTRKAVQDKVNNKIMSEVADAQWQIAEKAIHEWKQQQLDEVEVNLEQFISTNRPSLDNGVTTEA